MDDRLGSAEIRARKQTICGRSAIALLLIGLTACHHKPRPPVQPVRSIEAAGIIGLPNGGTIVAPANAPQAQLALFLASDAPAPRTFRFGEAEFTPWSASPNPQTRGALSAIILVLRAYPSAKVKVMGYTDNDGSVEANLKLSADRVVTLKNLLVDGGVGANRIDVEGMGMADPIADNGTDAGRARNRRVELVVVEK